MTVKKQALARRDQAANPPLLKAVVSDPRPQTARVFGYARVSTDEQSLDMQVSALRAAGCQDIFEEKISALNAKRPQFNLLMKHIEPGDTVVFYAFNRISRDLKFTLSFVDAMRDFGVALRSTSEPHIDPFSTNGRLLLSVTGAVDENERLRVRDRTRDGMKELQRQGMYLGRRKMFTDVQAAQIKRDRKHLSREEVARKWKCSPGTIDKYST